MHATLSLAPGFADPSRDAHKVFRAVMNALARPTVIQPLLVALRPPAPLPPELAAVALALADGDAPLWLDPPLAAGGAASAWLRFHTGAPIVTAPADAAFALVGDAEALPPFDAFAQGTEEFPDRSTTIVMAVESLDGPSGFTVEGPGLAKPAAFAPTPLPPDFAARLRQNRAMFPRGVDCVFTAKGQVAALPRSSRLVGEF